MHVSSMIGLSRWKIRIWRLHMCAPCSELPSILVPCHSQVPDPGLYRNGGRALHHRSLVMKGVCRTPSLYFILLYQSFILRDSCFDRLDRGQWTRGVRWISGLTARLTVQYRQFNLSQSSEGLKHENTKKSRSLATLQRTEYILVYCKYSKGSL